MILLLMRVSSLVVVVVELLAALVCNYFISFLDVPGTNF